MQINILLVSIRQHDLHKEAGKALSKNTQIHPTVGGNDFNSDHFDQASLLLSKRKNCTKN